MVKTIILLIVLLLLIIAGIYLVLRGIKVMLVDRFLLLYSLGLDNLNDKISEEEKTLGYSETKIAMLDAQLKDGSGKEFANKFIREFIIKNLL